MYVYQLYVKVNGRWEWQQAVRALDAQEALRIAIASLKPEHHDKSVWLEKADEPPPPEPDSTG